MNVRIQYQGIEGSPWMSEYLERKLTSLERYISPDGQVIIDVVNFAGKNLTRFYVRTKRQEYYIDREGDDLFEAFSNALDEISRILRQHHLRIMQKVHKKLAMEI